MSKFISFEDFLKSSQKARAVIVNGNYCRYALQHVTHYKVDSIFRWGHIEAIDSSTQIKFKIGRKYFKVFKEDDIFYYKKTYIISRKGKVVCVIKII